jgi:hypothetical protein
MVTVPEIITAMRDVIRDVDGINAAHYPAPHTIKQGPDVVMYWGGDTDTAISMDLSQRMWEPVVRAQILTPLRGNTPAEFAVIDDLITPIVDAFDTGSATQVMPSLSGAVNRCQVVRVRPTLLIDYAGSQFYGAEIYFGGIQARHEAGHRREGVTDGLQYCPK